MRLLLLWAVSMKKELLLIGLMGIAGLTGVSVANDPTDDAEDVRHPHRLPQPAKPPTAIPSWYALIRTLFGFSQDTESATAYLKETSHILAAAYHAHDVHAYPLTDGMLREEPPESRQTLKSLLNSRFPTMGERPQVIEKLSDALGEESGETRVALMGLFISGIPEKFLHIDSMAQIMEGSREKLGNEPPETRAALIGLITPKILEQCETEWDVYHIIGELRRELENESAETKVALIGRITPELRGKCANVWDVCSIIRNLISHMRLGGSFESSHIQTPREMCQCTRCVQHYGAVEQ